MENQTTKTTLGNKNALSVRLSPEDMEERSRLQMTDAEYWKYKTRLMKNSNMPVNGTSVVNTPVTVQKYNTSPSPDFLEEMRKRMEAESNAKILETKLAILNEQMNKITAGGLSGLDAAVEERMRKYEEDQEKKRLVNAEETLTAEVNELKAKLKEAEEDRDKLFEQVKMIEMAKAGAPIIAKVALGWKKGGLEGALAGLQELGENPEQKLLAEAQPQEFDEDTKNKIEFSDTFQSMFEDNGVRDNVLQICATLGKYPQLIGPVAKFMIEYKEPAEQTAEEKIQDKNTPPGTDDEYFKLFKEPIN